MMKQKWLIKPKVDHPNVIGVQSKIQDILAARGILGQDEMIEYLSEKPQLTYDPFLLKNMEEAVEAILRCIQQGKKICIYGDYDTDGVTAICLLLLFLGKMRDMGLTRKPLRTFRKRALRWLLQSIAAVHHKRKLLMQRPLVLNSLLPITT
jgi:hypothetical protein